MLSLAPDVTWASLFASVPARTPAVGARRLTVGVLTGCVQRLVFPRVNAATVNVLAAEGCDVIAPADQGCCGALALHAGRVDEARAFARRTIDVFERAGVERIAVSAAGCGSSMKEYGQLLAGDPAWAARARAFSARVRDVTESSRSLASQGAAPRTRDSRRVPRRLPSRARSGSPRAAARSPAVDPGRRDPAVCRTGDLLRERRHLQPGRA
jgi:Fe-S oxidoreductase